MMPRANLAVRIVAFLAGLGAVAPHVQASPTSPKLEPLPDKVVVLTLDDAVRSHFTVVRPILKELGFSATFFITEGFGFLTDRRNYMNWKQIRQLHLDGFEIGNHTRDHLAVTQQTLSRLGQQVEAITRKCSQFGIPQPVSFAYPENLFHLDALPILEAAGFKFARRGVTPEYPYEPGRGVAYMPGQDHPLLIPTALDARPNWTLEEFKAALQRMPERGVPVLQFHGVPDEKHPWVNTSPDRFREYMSYLKEEGYQVLALRDLGRYVDVGNRPSRPGMVILERVRSIREAEPDSR